jgi:N-acetylated-alpha-linked acidic dipeptidase
MKTVYAAVLSCFVIWNAAGMQLAPLSAGTMQASPNSAAVTPIDGFRDAVAESAIEKRFLAVPDAQLAEQHLKVLTQAPHIA